MEGTAPMMQSQPCAKIGHISAKGEDTSTDKGTFKCMALLCLAMPSLTEANEKRQSSSFMLGSLYLIVPAWTEVASGVWPIQHIYIYNYASIIWWKMSLSGAAQVTQGCQIIHRLFRMFWHLRLTSWSFFRSSCQAGKNGKHEASNHGKSGKVKTSGFRFGCVWK